MSKNTSLEIDFENLPSDILYHIALTQLHIDDLLRYCQVSQRLSEICRSESFWRQRFARDFPSYYPFFEYQAQTQAQSNWRKNYIDIYRYTLYKFDRTLSLLAELNNHGKNSNNPSLLATTSIDLFVYMIQNKDILNLPEHRQVKQAGKQLSIELIKVVWPGFKQYYDQL